jgi:hypothetical protein
MAFFPICIAAHFNRDGFLKSRLEAMFVNYEQQYYLERAEAYDLS